MHCPSCGKEIPDQSTFCLHCGTSIATPEATPISQAPIEWEYQEFVYKFPEGAMWAQLGESAYTEAGARLEFWQNYQQEIRLELQKWLDQGWQPVGEVGPASIQIRKYRALRYNWFGWLLFIIFTLLTVYTFGIFAYLTRPWYAEPTEFRLSMRRPKVVEPS